MSLICPECEAVEQPIDEPGFGLDVKNITTTEDVELGLKRFAVRCQGCGFATSFVGSITKSDVV